MVGLLGDLGNPAHHSRLAASSLAIRPDTWQMEHSLPNSVPWLPVCCVPAHHGHNSFQGLLPGPVEPQLFGGLDCDVGLFELRVASFVFSLPLGRAATVLKDNVRRL